MVVVIVLFRLVIVLCVLSWLCNVEILDISVMSMIIIVLILFGWR